MSELSADAVPKFEKKLKDQKEFKAREKREKFKELEKFESSKSFTLGPPSQKYRDNWEATFGNKSRNTISDESPEVAKADEMEVHQDTTGKSER